MRLQGLKIRLVVTVGGLLLVSMLLVNFILIIFWQRDVLQREIRLDKVVLSSIVDKLLSTPSLLQGGIPSNFFSVADYYPLVENGHILLHINAAVPVESYLVKDTLAVLLDRANVKTLHAGNPVTHYSASFLGLVHFGETFLVNTVPIVQAGSVVGSVGVVRSLEPTLQPLQKVEKVVVVYILVNLLILSVIGFFRMDKLVSRPIDRLVSLADQYHDQDPFSFTSESGGGEFGQLANSLNSMLSRIERDRKSLERTVEKLALANQKLKLHQQEMVRTEKMASVGRLAAGMAHEIGNPLGIVQGYLELVAGSTILSPEHLDFIKRAEDELQRVNILIRQVLDFSRLSRGEPVSFSLHELLRAVIDMVQMQPHCNNISLSTNLSSDRDTVYADPEQLRQVFVNSLLNSVDAIASAEHGVNGAISISTEVVEQENSDPVCFWISVRIVDNGIGIAEDQLHVIFDPFYTTKEPGKGTGLGLSVSMSIVEAIGGTITMESTTGQGCMLSVLLPLTDEKDV